jgi:ribosomal protein S12 methylthiotransferase
MKNKQQSRKKVAVLTLGCSKNVVDSENLIGLLDYNDIEITDNIGQADTVVINTCGFIADAKEESISIISQAADLKRQSTISQIIVMGCFSQRYIDTLDKNKLGVDYIFGVNSNEEVLHAIKQKDIYHIRDVRRLLTPPHYAYLKIAEGCNRECSFCAIPMIRGNYISTPQDKLIAETKQLVQAGVKEINIIAQDTTYYGRDLDGKSHLAELLDRLSDVEDVERIRLQYTYPAGFPTEVLDIIAQKPNICNYIDIPFQHISDKILKSMRRGTKSENIKNLIHTIRERIPDVAIRSTFIVGYPGESEDDFNELYDFIDEVKLDRVGVFTYSHEDDTHAFSLIDTVIEEEKERRKEEIMLLQQKISLEKNKAKTGNIFRVLVDEDKGNKYTGRTEHDAPDVDNLVHFTSKHKHKAGDFVQVKITEASEYDLYGEEI